MTRTDVIGQAHDALPLLLEQFLLSPSAASDGHILLLSRRVSQIAIGDHYLVSRHQEVYLDVKFCLHSRKVSTRLATSP